MAGFFQKGHDIQERALTGPIRASENVKASARDQKIIYIQGENISVVELDIRQLIVEAVHTRPLSCMEVNTILMRKETDISIIPSAKPKANSPLLVSSAMAVVIVLV